MITAKDLPKACFLCGRNGVGDPLDAHHIFGGANRKLSERYALVIPLCHDRCHENGKDAVHRNGAVAQAVHEFGQRLAMERMGWSIEEFRAVFGRNYLPEPSGSEDLGTGDEGSAPIGSPCEGRGTEDVTSVKDRGEAAASTRRGGATECQRASAETQSADAKPMRYATTRDGGFRITEEEDLPEWLLI